MFRFSGGLVLIQYNGLFGAAAGAVGAEVLPVFSAVPYRTRNKYPDWRFQYAMLRDVPLCCSTPVSVLVILQMQPQAFQTVPSLYWQQTIAHVPSDILLRATGMRDRDKRPDQFPFLIGKFITTVFHACHFFLPLSYHLFVSFSCPFRYF